MSRQSIIQSIEGMSGVVYALEQELSWLELTLVKIPNRIMDDAAYQGLPIEFVQYYRKRYLARNEQDLMLLRSDIYNWHIPYLNNVVEKLKDTLR